MTRRLVAFAVFLPFLLPVGVAAAQSAPQGPAPKPCAAVAERQRFDFWLGEWEVTDSTGKQRVGSSLIQSVSGGCALLENWTNARGGQGKSLTSYNPALSQWQQYWIGQDGQPTEFRESSWSGKSVVFRARTPAAGSAAATEQRLTFTPIDSVTVRQRGEQSTDGGSTWTTQYNFLYHRKR